MVVEDDILNRLLAVTLLKSAGYQVAEASDGQEALEELSSRVPELIVLDINMPRVSGMQVLQKLRNCAAWRNIPVLAVTAYAGAEDQRNIRAAGANEVLLKPHSIQDFISASAELLDTPPSDVCNGDNDSCATVSSDPAYPLSRFCKRLDSTS